MADDFRKFLVWDEAIKLGVSVHALIEALPSDEQAIMSASLHRNVVALPAGIALNLINHSPADMTHILELIAEVELVDSIYPALDTSQLGQALAALQERLADADKFRQTRTEPAATNETDEDTAGDDSDDDADDEEASGGEEPDEPEATSVKVET